MKIGEYVMFARLYRANIKFPTYRVAHVLKPFGKEYKNRYSLQRVDNLATVNIEPEEELIKLTVLRIHCSDKLINSIRHGKKLIVVPVTKMWDRASYKQYDLIHLFSNNKKNQILVSYVHCCNIGVKTTKTLGYELYKSFKITGWCKIVNPRLIHFYKWKNLLNKKASLRMRWMCIKRILYLSKCNN